MPNTQEETTLILLKPDCVRKNLSGTILKRFLSEGFRLRGIKMSLLADQVLREHYAHILDLVIYGEPLFPKLLDFMTSSPVIAIALKGPGVIVRVRELLGPTNSQKAQKGTIRGDFGTDSMMNICHASDSRESAAVELARFFREVELLDGLNYGKAAFFPSGSLRAAAVISAAALAVSALCLPWEDEGGRQRLFWEKQERTGYFSQGVV